jgi:predicted NUDIX family phosphoesterase
MEQVGIREVEKMEGRWVGVSELFELSARLESWSSLLLRPGFGQWLTRLR